MFYEAEQFEFKGLFEPAHCIGERYAEDGSDEIYLLAQVDENKVALIDLKSGNRWDNPMEVFDAHNITTDEFYRICNGFTFSLIKSEESI